jgi:3-hydroxyacyl-CoA dehydrogenase
MRDGYRFSSRKRVKEKDEHTMSEYNTIGFIGLGVMGEPICRNLVKKSGRRVIAFDLSPEPLARLRGEGADVAASVADE